VSQTPRTGVWTAERAVNAMESVAEVMTSSSTIYLKFDDEDDTQIAQIEEILTELARDGIWGLEFHRSQ
jgi:allophanate hydrolase subunit 1